MACLSHFHWVAFPPHALAGQLNNPNVISSEEIGLNSSDLMMLWPHKSASDWDFAGRTLATIFQKTARRCSVLKSELPCGEFTPSHAFLLFYKPVSWPVCPGAIFSAFSADADETSTCVSLTAFLCDTITMLGPWRGSINGLLEDPGKDAYFGGLWNEAAMDPQRFTCRKKKNVGTCLFWKQ